MPACFCKCERFCSPFTLSPTVPLYLSVFRIKLRLIIKAINMLVSWRH